MGGYGCRSAFIRTCGHPVVICPCKFVIVDLRLGRPEGLCPGARGLGGVCWPLASSRLCVVASSGSASSARLLLRLRPIVGTCPWKTG